MSVDSDQIAEALKRAQEIAAKMGAPGAQSNGGDDNGSRKRPLDEGEDGPQVKKPTMTDHNQTPQAIAQAAIAKLAPVVGQQLGINQMITVDIKIPNRMVGLVIGHSGGMINKLQADSAARIQVAPDGSEISGERIVTICGTHETVERAKILVNKVIEDAGGAVTSMPVHVELGQEVREMPIPANKVGLIIGKGGEMIKMLQEQSGCRMQMIQDGPYTHAPEKPLRMTGRPDTCDRAKKLVVELLKQKEMEAHGMMGPGGKIIEVQVPKSLVGFVIGRNGEHINNIQNTCNVKLQFQNDIPGMEYRNATISGPQGGDNCDRARKMIEDIVGEVRTKDMSRVGVGGGGGGGMPNPNFKPHIDLPNPTGPGVQTIQYPVPANKCGLIIGKGGDTIRQLQVGSNCHIELFRGVHPNPSEKLFTIRGNPQDIERAQQLINAKVENQPIPGGEGGFMAAGGMAYGGGAMYGQPPAGAPGYPPGQQPWQQQYQYPQGYPAQQQQQQQAGADPAQQAAWSAYYQQLYAAQAGGQQQGGPPVSGTAGGPDVQAQWAEYYRQLGMAYYGGQPGGSGPNNQAPPTSAGEQPK